MNKYIIFSISFLVFLGGVILVSKTSSLSETDSKVAGILKAEEIFFDFGTVQMSEGDVYHEFVVKNIGEGPVTLEKIYTSCACTTARLKIGEYQSQFFGMGGMGYIPKINKVLESGKEAVIEVMFDPAAHGPAAVGRVKRIIYLDSNSKENSKMQFSIEVNVVN